MITNIPLQTALHTLENAYLFSVMLLIAISHIAITAVEKMEKGDVNSPLSKWFI